jgi:hypothetical protein
VKMNFAEIAGIMAYVNNLCHRLALTMCVSTDFRDPFWAIRRT